MKHLNIKVYGDVVGVDFRWSAKLAAEELGIKGFARNEAGGWVYIEAEGPEKALEQFIDWCKIGSGYAKVDRVEVFEGVLKNFEDFKRV